MPDARKASRMDARFAIVLVAAGAGSRMRMRTPKQYLRIAGRTVLEHAILGLAQSAEIGWLQPVFAKDDRVGPKILARLQKDLPFRVLPPAVGGNTRAASVIAGIRALPKRIRWVAVHDAARPLVSADLLARVFAAARFHGAAAPGVPVVDTIKELDARGFVRRTPERARLVALQTPQAAQRAWFDQAIATLGELALACTDDMQMLEMAGFPVFICRGDPNNRKLTTKEDLAWLRRRLSASAKDSTRTASSQGGRSF